MDEIKIDLNNCCMEVVSEESASNPSPAATEKSETVRFRTSFFLFDPLSDPLTVLQLLPTDGVLHIGFHSICTVLFQHQ